MRDEIKRTCDLLFANREVVHDTSRWNDALMITAAALSYTGAGRQADGYRINECKKLIKENTGLLSSLRSTAEPIVVSKMSMAADPQQYIRDLVQVYDKISKAKFSEGAYIAQAALAVCDAGRAREIDELVLRFKQLFKLMSQDHPFLTSSEDIVFAMLLVMTDKPVDRIADEMEQCYSYLKEQLKHRVGANELQGISEVLVLLDADTKTKCDRVIRLYDTFAKHGFKYGAQFGEFASLGVFADMDGDYDALVDEIMELEAYLKGNKGFGGLNMDKKQRMLFATVMVKNAYATCDALALNAAINTSVAVIVAEEIAIMTCVYMSIITSNSSS